FFMSATLIRPFSAALACECQIASGRLPRFLDEAVERDNSVLLNAEQDTRDPVSRKIAPHLPQPVAQRTAQPHPDRPVMLNPHQVLPEAIAVGLGKPAQPIAHYLAAARRSVEDHRQLARRINRHPASYM